MELSNECSSRMGSSRGSYSGGPVFKISVQRLAIPTGEVFLGSLQLLQDNSSK
jgi:hypothetical protein